MYQSALSVMTKHHYPAITPEFALFMTVWANAAEISYNPKWMSELGYLTGALDLKIDSNRSCTDDLGRKMLIIPNVDSNLVVYENAPGSEHYVFIRRTATGKLVQDGFTIEHPDVLEVVDLLQRQIRERRIASGHRYS